MDNDIRARFRSDLTNRQVPRPRAPTPPPPHAGEFTFNRPAARPAPKARPHEEPQDHRPHQPISSQPLRPEVSFEAPPQYRAHLRSSRSRLKLLVVIVFSLIILGGAAAGYWYKYQRVTVPIPANIRGSASYPLLYPSKLPPGYTINQSSFTNSGGAVIFEANNSGGNKIVFSLQKRPSTFDFSSFYKQGLGNAAPFTTPAGEAAVGTANGQTLGSFVTDQAWMLVTAPNSHLSSDDFRLVLQNIKIAPKS